MSLTFWPIFDASRCWGNQLCTGVLDSASFQLPHVSLFLPWASLRWCPGVYACATGSCQHPMRKPSQREWESVGSCFPFSSLMLKILMCILHSFLEGPRRTWHGPCGHVLSLLPCFTPPCPWLLSAGITLQNNLPFQKPLSQALLSVKNLG